ncbi:DUF4190 domain-containing protein [Streptomyces sp. NBC_00178]|uniref:DUF4190 domain-containing protein n=1 Tax=Streptomyces sp. NBC_00178 TaxID=2975672 RepID=UPI002E2D3707|nr:DUF4190 domain-containing protein [Streptomyces sp. NBC_00178]
MTLTTAHAGRSTGDRLRRNRPDARPTSPATATRDTSSGEAAPGGTGAGAGPAARTRKPSREADGLAVASFVLGLLGLLVMNILLGPVAIVMALVALARSTTRRGRALLGLGLGVADLIVLAVLVTANGTVSWSLAG